MSRKSAFSAAQQRLIADAKKAEAKRTPAQRRHDDEKFSKADFVPKSRRGHGRTSGRNQRDK